MVDAARVLPQERKRLYVAGTRRDVAAALRGDGRVPFEFPRLPDLRSGVQDVLQSTSRSGGDDDENDDEDALTRRRRSSRTRPES